MKKIIALLLLTLAVSAQAQERVFQTVYKMASKIANDPREDAEVRKVAQFRVDAVTYLNTQTLAALTDTTHRVSDEQAARLSERLDSMAYFMYDYVDLFQKEYQHARTEKAKEQVVKLFRSVSITCPLYNDSDREYVMCYVNSDGVITQFSLDTDWVRACTVVRQRLREQ